MKYDKQVKIVSFAWLSWDQTLATFLMKFETLGIIKCGYFILKLHCYTYVWPQADH